MNRNIAGKAIPKHTIGMWTASESACIWRAWRRSGCAPAACARSERPAIVTGHYPALRRYRRLVAHDQRGRWRIERAGLELHDLPVARARAAADDQVLAAPGDAAAAARRGLGGGRLPVRRADLDVVGALAVAAGDERDPPVAGDGHGAQVAAGDRGRVDVEAVRAHPHELVPAAVACRRIAPAEHEQAAVVGEDGM